MIIYESLNRFINALISKNIKIIISTLFNKITKTYFLLIYTRK